MTPYQSITQPDGTSANYAIDCADPNQGKVGTFLRVEGEPLVPMGMFIQGLPMGDRGWQDENRSPLADGHIEKVPPLYRDGAWRPAMCRYWNHPPFGAFGTLVWPTESGALTVRTNNSTIRATVTGSPCESLIVIGNNNRVVVSCDSGEQSRLMLTRPAVKIVGNENTISGWVRHPLCGVYFRGNNNNVRNLTVVLGPLDCGDDKGAVYYEGKAGQYGAAIDGLTVVSEGEAYARQHMTALLYFDDKFGGTSMAPVTVRNVFGVGPAMYGVFAHGGNYIQIYGVEVWGVGTGVKFAPHFKTPTIQPIGCSAKNVVVK